MPRLLCPKCGSQKRSWKVRRNKRVCSNCRYEWNPKALPLRLTRNQWKQLIKWFIFGHSIDTIANQTKINRECIMRALLITREVMKTDIPKQFTGIVEVDETYIGGQWKNKRLSVRAKGIKRGRGTSKQPVFGIYCRNGKVWAELVDDAESKTLQPLIKKQVKKGTTICSDTWKGYTGIATKGYVHRLIEHKDDYSDCKGTHINGLEGFWGCLKRRLAAKGGIRRDRLGLYLAEYVWRYNNRKLGVGDKVKKLIRLLNKRRLLVG